MRKLKAKPELVKFRANQRKAKERKRLQRGESDLSQELRWLHSIKQKPLYVTSPIH